MVRQLHMHFSDDPLSDAQWSEADIRVSQDFQVLSRPKFLVGGVETSAD